MRTTHSRILISHLMRNQWSSITRDATRSDKLLLAYAGISELVFFGGGVMGAVRGMEIAYANDRDLLSEDPSLPRTAKRIIAPIAIVGGTSAVTACAMGTLALLSPILVPIFLLDSALTTIHPK